MSGSQVAIPTNVFVLVVLHRKGIHVICVWASWAHHALNLVWIKVHLCMVGRGVHEIWLRNFVYMVCMNSPKDWTLWGSQLGVEGQSVPIFLTMLLGWSWFWVISPGTYGLMNLAYPKVEADDWLSSGYSSSWERVGLSPWEDGATIRPVFFLNTAGCSAISENYIWLVCRPHLQIAWLWAPRSDTIWVSDWKTSQIFDPRHGHCVS